VKQTKKVTAKAKRAREGDNEGRKKKTIDEELDETIKTVYKKAKRSVEDEFGTTLSDEDEDKVIDNTRHLGGKISLSKIDPEDKKTMETEDDFAEESTKNEQIDLIRTLAKVKTIII